jgi:DNA-binding XRE family transcriptional regulator
MANAHKVRNAVQQLREERLMSKAELARRAGVSPLTIDRVERGASCRLDTKRKIILALGMKVADRGRVFFDGPGGHRGSKRA